MTYELANQLKDAGFDAGELVTAMYFDQSQPIGEPYLPNPTLSELIEACGEGFYLLLRDGDRWICGGSRSDAHTPEEAVARLWLELNKKS